MAIKRTIQSSIKCFSSRRAATSIVYNSFGSPTSVLSKTESPSFTGPATGDNVYVKMLAATINPSDINMIEGVYGVKPTFPAIGGNEGVGVVESVGDKVTGLAPGDWVIPNSAGFGTWRQEAVVPASSLFKVPNDLPMEYAASLSVNPPTAYRMLRDYVGLKEGDWLIQNGSNSQVGLCVIQMAREMGVKTINIVRSTRPNVDETIRMLTNLGSDTTLMDSQLGTPFAQSIFEDLPPIQLGLNCVGGEGVSQMARVLGQGATLVTYGAMSKQHVSLPLDLLAYKQLSLKGMWMAKWASEPENQAERRAMTEHISAMMRDKKLSLFFRTHDLDDFDYALKVSQEPFALRKVALNLNYPDRLAEHDQLTEEDYWPFQAQAVTL